MADVATAPAAPPNVHPGERLANYFDNFFKTVTAISTFGASLTFSKIAQTPVAPWDDHGFSKISIQYLMANAFLFFVLDLGITSFAASALTLYRPQAVSWFGTNDSGQRRVVMWYAAVVSVLLFGLLMAAFVFVALVVAAYAGAAGWIALAATTLFGAMGFGTIVWQSPLFRPSIGAAEATIATDMRIYGYSDEKSDRYTTPTKRRRPADKYTPERIPSAGNTGGRRQDSRYADDGRVRGYAVGAADTGYNSEKRMAVDGRYVADRLSWGGATAPHVPLTSADHYYEDRRSSRTRRVSVPKYSEYEDDRF